MSGGLAVQTAPTPLEWWRRLRNPGFWMPVADTFAVLTALALPWSTSLVGILALLWLGSAAVIVDYPSWLRSLKQPACALPLVLFALAAVGTLWSEAAWAARLHALAPYSKFLLLPGLLHHFARSSRGMWVFVAFLVSCTLMMAASWITAFEPAFTLKPVAQRMCGVFVKNSIDQGQEFSLCAVAMAYPIMTLLQQGKRWQAVVLIAIASVMVLNMIVVTPSRTAMVTTPLLLALFALQYLSRRVAILLGVATVVLVSVWAISPRMCRSVETFQRDMTLYSEENVPTSAGLRVEYWKKSIQFIGQAPLAGHGTGSIRGLFEKAATGRSTDASAHVIANPHNQTLHTAIQWGILGVIPLYLMWVAHLRLFRGRGLIAWIGCLVVVQNMLTSLFNSHIVDFHAGWMYVLGVGVAGGMMMKQRTSGATEPQVR